MAVSKFAAAAFATGALGVWLSGSEQALAAPNGCEAAKAIELIGQPAPTDAEVRAKTGSTLVRRTAPGEAATLDFEPGRITLEIENGVITYARCG